MMGEHHLVNTFACRDHRCLFHYPVDVKLVGKLALILLRLPSFAWSIA